MTTLDSLPIARLADGIAKNDLWVISHILTYDLGFIRPEHCSTAEWLAQLAVRGGRQRTVMRRGGGNG